MSGLQILQLLKKTLSNFDCRHHQQPYSHIDLATQQLLCQNCYFNSSPASTVLLEKFLNCPALAFLSPAKQQQLLGPNALSSVKKKLKQSKQALNLFLDSLTKSVIEQCGFMKKKYEEVADAQMLKLQQQINRFEADTLSVSEVFYEKLGSTSLSSQQSLKDTISGFIKQITGQSCTQNIRDNLNARMKKIKKLTVEFPFLRLQKLKRLYVQTCDPMKWNLNNFVQHFNFDENADVNNIGQVFLADHRHVVRYDRQKIQIVDKILDQVVGQCANQTDICFQISGFRFVAGNELQTNIYSYLDPSNPKILQSLNIRYPTQMRYCSPYIYYVSEGSLQRLDAETIRHQVVFSGKDIEFKVPGNNIDVVYVLAEGQHTYLINVLLGQKNVISMNQYLQIP